MAKKFKEGAWSKKEVEYLKKNYGKYTAVQIARKLNRNPSSMSTKIRQLKLVNKHREEYAIYLRDEYQFNGTKDYCCKRLGIKETTFNWTLYRQHTRDGDLYIVELGRWLPDE